MEGGGRGVQDTGTHVQTHTHTQYCKVIILQLKLINFKKLYVVFDSMPMSPGRALFSLVIYKGKLAVHEHYLKLTEKSPLDNASL